MYSKCKYSSFAIAKQCGSKNCAEHILFDVTSHGSAANPYDAEAARRRGEKIIISLVRSSENTLWQHHHVTEVTFEYLHRMRWRQWPTPHLVLCQIQQKDMKKKTNRTKVIIVNKVGKSGIPLASSFSLRLPYCPLYQFCYCCRNCSFARRSTNEHRARRKSGRAEKRRKKKSFTWFLYYMIFPLGKRRMSQSK